MTANRMKPEDRRGQIVKTALELAAEGHYTRVARDEIAGELEISGPAIQYHFTSMEHLRGAVIQEALVTECLPVVAQAMVNRDSRVKNASRDLRMRAMRFYLGDGA